MSTTTTNFKFILPELSDPADITQMNQNWETLDETLNDLDSIPVTSEVPEDSDIWIDPDDVAVEEFYGVSKTLLWENADPSSEFRAQTIRIDYLWDYDGVEIVYTGGGYTGGYGNAYLSSGMLPKIVGSAMDTYYYTDGYALTACANFYNGGNTSYYRLVDYGSDYLTFEDCNVVDIYNSSSTDNIYLVPTRIYGIKGVQ